MRRTAILLLIGSFALVACAPHSAISPAATEFSATPAVTTIPTARPTPSPSATIAPTSSPLETAAPLNAESVFGVPIDPTGAYFWTPELPQIIETALGSLPAEEQSPRVTAEAINTNVGTAAVVVVGVAAPGQIVPPESLLSQITGVPPDELRTTVIAGRSVLLADNFSLETFETGVSWDDENLVIVLLTDSPGSAETFITMLDQAMSGSIPVTFRLTLSGTVPADATFALEDGFAGDSQMGSHQGIYLCSLVTDGYPPCTDGGIYEDVLEAPPGAVLSYRFWREFVNGPDEEIMAGEVTVDPADPLVPVTYEFP